MRTLVSSHSDIHIREEQRPQHGPWIATGGGSRVSRGAEIRGAQHVIVGRGCIMHDSVVIRGDLASRSGRIPSVVLGDRVVLLRGCVLRPPRIVVRRKSTTTNSLREDDDIANDDINNEDDDDMVDFATLTIGNDTIIGEDAVVNARRVGTSVVIGNGVVVGCGAEIDSGVRIASRTLVTPGTRVASNSLVSGVPGSIVGTVSHADNSSRATLEEQIAFAQGIVVHAADVGTTYVIDDNDNNRHHHSKDDSNMKDKY